MTTFGLIGVGCRLAKVKSRAKCVNVSGREERTKFQKREKESKRKQMNIGRKDSKKEQRERAK